MFGAALARTIAQVELPRRMVNTPAMPHTRKQTEAGKARRARMGTVFADGSALHTGPDGTTSLIVEARTPYRATRRKRAVKNTEHSSKAQTGDGTDDSLAEWRARLLTPEQAPTEATLAEVWKRWHALPSRLDNDERKTALLTSNVYLFPRTIVAAVKLLSRRFGLPLDEKQYATSVDTAFWWCEFREYVNCTLALGEAFLRANLAFERVDDQAPGRVAAYRTQQELLRLKLTILDQKSPSLADIVLVRSTHDAYLRARQHAQVLLNKILYPRAIQRGSQGLDASVLLDQIVSQKWGNLMDAQARHDAPILMPRPPGSLPRHLQIAQLAALGKADRIVRDFMATRFLKLPKTKRNEFLRVFDNPPSLATRYGPAATWLADNAPLLRRLRNQWHDVQELAESVFPVADLPRSWRNFSNAHGIKLDFKRGANFINRDGLTCNFVRPLLSPPPRLSTTPPAR